MASTGFTFVNNTGTAGLSQSAAKQMRSHITKTNFAKRRQRLSRVKMHETNHYGPAGGRQRPTPGVCDEAKGSHRTDSMQAVIQTVDSYHQAEFIFEFWSLVFLDGSGCPRNEEEAAWIRLIASEPSLLQSTMAIGIKHWSPTVLYQEMAQMYWSRATNNVIQHISSATAYTDAILLTVATMAFGERLMQNEHAWNVHIDGLAQMIRHRYSRGAPDLPSWFYDLVILDAINDVLGFPRIYHKKIVEAVRVYGSNMISKVANLCERLKKIRQTKIVFEQDQLGADISTEWMDERVQSMLYETRSLSTSHMPSVQATALVIELIILLSWSSQTGAELTSIAEKLKLALCQLPVRPCSYMDLTSCQVMVGAVAANEGSEIQEWFRSKIKNAMVALQKHGSFDLRDRLETCFVSQASGRLSFGALWCETTR